MNSALWWHFALQMITASWLAYLEGQMRESGFIPHRPTYGNMLFTTTEWVLVNGEPGNAR